eukprot:TRINITY_DN32529_c0_g1_i1.p1 TRINITY_DN32529_c0_g1~~TRINITY_DN32529_c0_g1_i1.p1  ORF type:complete len:126 (-),score=0.83 TRINITY_DN32529_c0_g1_i1:101-478(-)
MTPPRRRAQRAVFSRTFFLYGDATRRAAQRGGGRSPSLLLSVVWHPAGVGVGKGKTSKVSVEWPQESPVVAKELLTRASGRRGEVCVEGGAKSQALRHPPQRHALSERKSFKYQSALRTAALLNR